MTKKFASFFLLIVSDLLAILLSFLFAYIIRSYILPLLFLSLHERPVFFYDYIQSFSMYILIYILWPIVLIYRELYTRRYFFWEEVRLLLKSTTFAFVLIMVVVFMTKQNTKFSRLIIISAWILSTFFLPFFRYVIKTLLNKFNLWNKKAIILGTAESSFSLIQAAKENRTLGYEIVGCLSDNRKQIGNTISGVKIWGHFDEIEEWKTKTGFEDIIVALPNVPHDKLIPLLKRWEQISESIQYIPRTGDLVSTGIETENIGGILSLTVRNNLHKSWNVFLKTVFEYFLTLILFIFLLPFFLFIAFTIKLDSNGSIFFVQNRYGKRGKRIKVIKFRSMYLNADSRLQEYLRSSPTAIQELTRYKKLRSFDPRVTRVGKFLRKFSLDELPQFLNVLKGDMSLVGPRPYIMEELKEAESTKSVLLQVKPGITGLWQISGRSSLPFKERIKIDEHYIRNWSLWFDIVILLKTIRIAISAKGAF